MGLIQTIIVVFGVIAIAYAAAHFKLLDERVGDGLSDFVFVIAAPLLLFRTMVTADFHGTAPWSLWTTYFIGVIVAWAASDLAIKLFFRRDNRAGVVAGVSGAFSNLVFLGMPLMLGVFGQNGFAILSLIVAVHMPVMMAASITLHELAMRRDGVFKGESHWIAVIGSFFNSLLRNPFVLGILAGWIWRLLGLRMPDAADALIETLSGVAGPVALFAMGMGLKKFGISGNMAAAVAHVCYQTCPHACGGAWRRVVDWFATIHRENRGGCRGASGWRQFLLDRHTLWHGPGSRLQFHGHDDRFFGADTDVLGFCRYADIWLTEPRCSFWQKGAG